MKLAIIICFMGLLALEVVLGAAAVKKQRSINAPYDKDLPPPPPENHGKGRNAGKNSGRPKRSLTCGNQPLMTPEQAEESVYAHNHFRALEKAADMLKMTWSDEMAAVAQAWADQCTWKHDMLYDCSGDRLGQNLFVEASTGGFPALNVTAVIEAWNDERNDWDFATGQCKTGKVCGHWTQVTWAQSTQVGCAYAQCSTMDVGGDIWKNALYVVCDYTPPGNVYGQAAFISGESCSNCDSQNTGHAFHCEKNLCVQCSPATDATCTCGPSPGCFNGGTWSTKTCNCECGTEFFGPQCEYPCTCDDVQPENCPYWLQYCTEPMYSDFMYDNCKGTCQYECHLPSTCAVAAVAK